jgi:hypothetical protein
LVGGLLCFVTISRATTIEYVATDLVDLTPGEDLWRYDYTVSGRAFLSSEFFDIYFVPSVYGTLALEPTANTDWDVRILQQPNPVNLPPFDTGIFDAFASIDNASVADAFSVNFVYLGTGTPGAQMFDIFDANANLLESGITARPGGVIPEPSTIMLSVLGLAVLGSKFHRARKTAR